MLNFVLLMSEKRQHCGHFKTKELHKACLYLDLHPQGNQLTVQVNWHWADWFLDKTTAILKTILKLEKYTMGVTCYQKDLGHPCKK